MPPVLANPTAAANDTRDGIDDLALPGWQTQTVVRYGKDGAQPSTDPVADEWPVALVFNGISHAVMMATPRDLEPFAVGFALSEGIIASAAEILDVEVEYGASSAAIHVTLLQQSFAALKEQRRSLAGRTGCGVCGIESIELLDLQPAPIAANELARSIEPAAIARAARELAPRQTLMRRTGGVHAAAWCAPDGAVRHVFEDVGRHNALDKLIGTLIAARQSTTDGFVFLSSRASYELLRKAARVDIPMVATISAPTALAISIARQAGIRLVSFCRDDGFVEYAAAPGASVES